MKLPVQLGRLPVEEPHPELREFYTRLLQAQRDPVLHDGTYFALASRSYHGADRSHEGLISHAWSLADALRVVVINLGPAQASARLMLPPFPGGTRWRFRDVLRDDVAPVFTAEQLRVQGLPVFLGGHTAHLFFVERCD